MTTHKRGQRGRGTGELTIDEQAKLMAVLHRLHTENDRNAAEVGRLIGMSGPGVRQLLAGTQRPGVDTARALAKYLGVRPWQVVDPELAPRERTERTARNDLELARALRSATLQEEWPDWIAEHLARLPMPLQWVGVTDEFYRDIAYIWLKWDKRFRSGVRAKTEGNR